MKKRIAFIFFSLIIVSVLILNHKNKIKKYETNLFYFDTVITLTVYTKKEEAFLAARDEIKDEFNRINEKFNYEKLTEKLIQDADSDETFFLARAAFDFHELFDGYFNPLIAKALKEYGFLNGGEFSPLTNEKIKEILPLTKINNLRFKNGFVKLNDGCLFTGGGYIKGYALEKALEIIEEYAGIKGAIVNAGGDIAVWGEHPERKEFTIGVRHPDKAGELIKIIKLKGKHFIITSGDYERSFFYEGRSYHHILNPFTLLPPQNTRSVTVVAKENGMLADALATALFVSFGENRNLDILEKINFTGTVYLTDSKLNEYFYGDKNYFED